MTAPLIVTPSPYQCAVDDGLMHDPLPFFLLDPQPSAGVVAGSNSRGDAGSVGTI